MSDAEEETEPLWKRALLLREQQQTATRYERCSHGTEHGAKVRQGQERARARGVRVGRPTNQRLTPDVLERARKMSAAGLRVRDIAADLHVPKSTLHRALQVAQVTGSAANIGF